MDVYLWHTRIVYNSGPLHMSNSAAVGSSLKSGATGGLNITTERVRTVYTTTAVPPTYVHAVPSNVHAAVHTYTSIRTPCCCLHVNTLRHRTCTTYEVVLLVSRYVCTRNSRSNPTLGSRLGTYLCDTLVLYIAT